MLRPLAAFQRRGQRGDALLQHRKGIAVAARARDSGRPWTTTAARRRKAAPARRWRRRWRRWRAAPRSRLRAAAPWRDRHWRAGSCRAWRRDCGSPRHSRRAARPASASAAPRGFRRARARYPRAPGRRCRSGGCRRCGAAASGSRSRSISIARRGIASVMAARISASSWRKAVIDCSMSGRCSDSIWLVILNRCRSSDEKSGPGGGGGGGHRGCDRRRVARRHRARRRRVELVLARGDLGDRNVDEAGLSGGELR